jgi:hypothetical protein
MTRPHEIKLPDEVPPEMLPPLPWARLDDLPRSVERKVTGTCETGSYDHCVGAQFIAAFGKLQGRQIRFLAVKGSRVYWSEFLPAFNAWARLYAPITDQRFVKSVNNFDKHSKRFVMPSKSPCGATVFANWCRTSPETAEKRAARQVAYEARIQAGTVQHRKFKRAPLHVEPRV